MRKSRVIPAILLGVLLSGCATFDSQNYRQTISPNQPNARYFDGEIVLTSVGTSSAVELRLRKRESSIETFLEAELYIENLSVSTIDYFPDHVGYVAITDNLWDKYHSTKIVYWQGADPDRYSSVIADRMPEGTGSAIGGFASYLSGATIGEAIIAQNQSNAASVARRVEDAEQRETTREELLARHTLRPGEAVAGGVGFRRVGEITFHSESDMKSQANGLSFSVVDPDSIDVVIEQVGSAPRLSVATYETGDRRYRLLTEAYDSFVRDIATIRTSFSNIALPNAQSDWGMYDRAQFIFPINMSKDERAVLYTYIVVEFGDDAHIFPIGKVVKP